MAQKKKQQNQPTVDDLKAPLLAAVGAADLALERVNEIVAALRERAEEARTDANTRVEESRARLTKLQEDLPANIGELRERAPPTSCAGPPRATRTPRPPPTTSSSSVARLPWSGCVASPGSARPPSASRATPTRPSS